MGGGPLSTPFFAFFFNEFFFYCFEKSFFFFFENRYLVWVLAKKKKYQNVSGPPFTYLF